MTRFFWRPFEQASPDCESAAHLPGRDEAEIARTLATLLQQLKAPDLEHQRPDELLTAEVRQLLNRSTRRELVALMMASIERLSNRPA